MKTRPHTKPKSDGTSGHRWRANAVAGLLCDSCGMTLGEYRTRRRPRCLVRAAGVLP